jgi:hypothetical protein
MARAVSRSATSAGSAVKQIVWGTGVDAVGGGSRSVSLEWASPSWRARSALKLAIRALICSLVRPTERGRRYAAFSGVRCGARTTSPERWMPCSGGAARQRSTPGTRRDRRATAIRLWASARVSLRTFSQ